MTSKARFVLVWSVLCFCASIVQTYRDNDNVACFFVCFLFFLLFFHTMGAGSRVMIAWHGDLVTLCALITYLKSFFTIISLQGTEVTWPVGKTIYRGRK